jgi:hypothetical protein
MLAAFTGKPRILRLYCRGRVVTRSSGEWALVSTRFPKHDGVRQIIVGDVELVQTSCGYAVPEMNLIAERDLLRQCLKRADKKASRTIAVRVIAKHRLHTLPSNGQLRRIGTAHSWIYVHLELEGPGPHVEFYALLDDKRTLTRRARGNARSCSFF